VYDLDNHNSIKKFKTSLKYFHSEIIVCSVNLVVVRLSLFSRENVTVSELNLFFPTEIVAFARKRVMTEKILN
jgi:hypothetical protein